MDDTARPAPAASGADPAPPGVGLAGTDQDRTARENGPIPEPEPLGRKAFNIRTLVSFGIGAAILYFLVRRANLDVAAMVAQLSQVDVLLYLVAALVYYLTFIIRGLRWRLLLSSVGYTRDGRERIPPLLGLSEIILISWFVNCVVPAKLGDMYRAYLLKKNADVSFSKTFGTIVAERIMDMLLMFALLVGSALVTFHGALPPTVVSLMQGGLLLAGLLVLGLLAMRSLSQLIHRVIPGRFRSHYSLLEEGTLRSFSGWPALLVYTAAAWAVEAGRLYFVSRALGLEQIPLVSVFFLSLAGALLTTLPVTPAGLGFVELALVELLQLVAAVNGVALSPTTATSLAFLDRTISYWSLILVGLVVYLVSRRR